MFLPCRDELPGSRKESLELWHALHQSADDILTPISRLSLLPQTFDEGANALIQCNLIR